MRALSRCVSRYCSSTWSRSASMLAVGSGIVPVLQGGDELGKVEAAPSRQARQHELGGCDVCLLSRARSSSFQSSPVALFERGRAGGADAREHRECRVNAARLCSAWLVRKARREV